MRAWLLERPWIVLIVALIVHTVLFAALQRDLAAADPLWYATKAHDLAFHPSQLFGAHNKYPFVMRLGLLGPIALMYRLFGVSTLATNLPCLLAGLGILVIVYAAPSTPRGKLLAVLLALVCTPLVADAHELNPDLPCAAMMAATVLCLSRRDRPRGAAWVVAAVLAWFAAFQIKEVAIWLVPVWIYAAIGDVREHGVRWFARTIGPGLAVGAGLTAGYLVFCAMLWGDPLARLHGIDDAASSHEWSLAGKPAAEWVARLAWEPALLLFRLFRIALLPVVISPWLVARRDRLWIVATASVVLLYWFGSSTGSAYLPLPIWRRMMLPALPGIVVVSALAIDAAIDRIRSARWGLVLGAAFGLWLVVAHVHSLAKTIPEAGQPEDKAFAALRAEVASSGDRVVLVCGDPRCPMISRYYFDFDPPSNLAVVSTADLAAAPLPAGARVRVLANLTRSGGVARDVARRAEALALHPITWDPEVRLYDARDGAQLRDALTHPP